MDTSRYNIDENELLQQLVPPFWITTPETGAKKTVWEAYLKVMSSAFKNVFALIYAKATEVNEFLIPTGQHLSLEYYLNDLYDNIQRRIYITENDIPQVDQIWYKYTETDAENKVWYEQGESDPAPKTFYTTVENKNRNHFTIYIPSSITYVENVLRGQINPYVVNGYNFNIVTF